MIIALKAIMDSKGISAQELSEITGISKIAIWNYASGRNKPDPETLCTIADALDVSLDMLVRGEEISSVLDVYSTLSKASQKAFWSALIKSIVPTKTGFEIALILP